MTGAAGKRRNVESGAFHGRLRGYIIKQYPKRQDSALLLALTAALASAIHPFSFIHASIQKHQNSCSTVAIANYRWFHIWTIMEDCMAWMRKKLVLVIRCRQMELSKHLFHVEPVEIYFQDS